MGISLGDVAILVPRDFLEIEAFTSDSTTFVSVFLMLFISNSPYFSFDTHFIHSCI